MTEDDRLRLRFLFDTAVKLQGGVRFNVCTFPVFFKKRIDGRVASTSSLGGEGLVWKPNSMTCQFGSRWNKKVSCAARVKRANVVSKTNIYIIPGPLIANSNTYSSFFVGIVGNTMIHMDVSSNTWKKQVCWNLRIKSFQLQHVITVEYIDAEGPTLPSQCWHRFLFRSLSLYQIPFVVAFCQVVKIIVPDAHVFALVEVHAIFSIHSP